MVGAAAELADAAQIPWGAREQADFELRREAFELLHAEAVRRGDLPAPPRAASERFVGRLLETIFMILAGGVLGLIAAAATLFLLRIGTLAL